MSGVTQYHHRQFIYWSYIDFFQKKDIFHGKGILHLCSFVTKKKRFQCRGGSYLMELDSNNFLLFCYVLDKHTGGEISQPVFPKIIS